MGAKRFVPRVRIELTTFRLLAANCADYETDALPTAPTRHLLVIVATQPLFIIQVTTVYVHVGLWDR